jgi:hypothetical protein
LIEAIKSIYNNTKVRIKLRNNISQPLETTKGVRQGCTLSPLLFNIYLNHMIQKWLLKAESHGIQLQKYLKITALLYADDQVILSNDEDDLQRATKHLNDIAKEYGMKNQYFQN